MSCFVFSKCLGWIFNADKLDHADTVFKCARGFTITVLLIVVINKGHYNSLKMSLIIVISRYSIASRTPSVKGILTCIHKSVLRPFAAWRSIANRFYPLHQ